jgi:hypothetical protein
LTISEKRLTPDSINVADNGRLYTTAAVLKDVQNEGVCIFRSDTDVKKLTNNGQVVVSKSRIDSGTNNRFIYLLSKSYMHDIKCTAHSATKVSSSFVVACDIHDKASLDVYTAIVVACTGKLKNIRYPDISDPDFAKEDIETQLYIRAIHFNAQIGNGGRRTAKMIQEANDIETLLTSHPNVRLSGVIASKLLLSIWSTPVEKQIKQFVIDNRRLKLPYK